eukprot:jgi/Picre1/27494/NNA_000461.t1
MWATHSACERVTPRIDGRITAKQSAASRKTAATGTKSSGSSYLNVTGFPFPLGPLTQRQTIRRRLKRE